MEPTTIRVRRGRDGLMKLMLCELTDRGLLDELINDAMKLGSPLSFTLAHLEDEGDEYAVRERDDRFAME